MSIKATNRGLEVETNQGITVYCMEKSKAQSMVSFLEKYNCLTEEAARTIAFSTCIKIIEE